MSRLDTLNYKRQLGREGEDCFLPAAVLKTHVFGTHISRVFPNSTLDHLYNISIAFKELPEVLEDLCLD